MSEHKHTPGPWEWRWDSRNKGYAATCLLSTEGHVVIDLADDWDGAPESGQLLVMELSPADARLISAAPQLLAVCEAYEELEADLLVNGDWSAAAVRMSQEQHDRMMQIQAIRNAAINKVRGASDAG